MIIINIVYGQLCNQLFLFAHLLAYALSKGRRVSFPGFREKEAMFAYFSRDRKTWSRQVFLPFTSAWSQRTADRILRRLFHGDSKLLRLMETVARRKLHVSLDFLIESMLPETTGSNQPTRPFCLFEGWMFRVPSAFRTFAPQLRSIFKFREEEINHARTFLKSLPEATVIGVHIRQSDYSSMAPQWHYSPARYLDWMRQLRGDTDVPLHFVVVSDGKLPDFQESWVHVHRGAAIQDLCLLSQCDRIMGPPSTFNRWAAFMGEKQHLCLWNENQTIKDRDFAPFKMLSGESLSAQDMEVIKFFGIV